MPLIKFQIDAVDIDLLLCSKKCYAQDLTNLTDFSSKKSFNSI